MTKITRSHRYLEENVVDKSLKRGMVSTHAYMHTHIYMHAFWHT